MFGTVGAENILVGLTMLISMGLFLFAAMSDEGTKTGKLLALGLFFGVAARFVAMVL